MTRRSLTKKLLAGLTAVAAFGSAAVTTRPSEAVAAESSPAQATSSLSSWSRLRYTTSKLLIFSGELTMTRSVTGDKTMVRTDSQARLFGSPFVESWSLSTMDRKTGRPLEFLDVRPEKKAERWRFLDNGVEHAVLKPHQGRAKDPVETWKVMKTEKLTGVEGRASPVRSASPGGASSVRTSGPSVSPASTSQSALQASVPPRSGASVEEEIADRAETSKTTKEGGTASSQWVHDYISMIVRLKDFPLARIGDEATVRVMTSRGPAPMRIRVGETRTTSRSITDLVSGRSRRVEMKELRLRVTPLAGSQSDTRGFLNMEGETELWVDAATRTLTEISGNVPKVPGRVVITLAGYK